jgi:glycosyltransferase involved in cell wall biosynthesis
MRILLIGKRHYTNQDALAQRFGRIYQLPVHWHQAGHNVQMILVDYHGRHSEVSSQDGFEVQSLPAFDPRTAMRAFKSISRFRPDLILASGDCFVGLLGWHLARRADARFVFDVYDDYRTFGAYRAFMGWDALAFLCRRADLVTYASRAMDERHAFSSEHFVVPNGVDTSAFIPMPMAKARRELDLPDGTPLIGYFGSMTAEHGVAILVQALELLRIKRPDLRLVICGKRPESMALDGDGVIYRGMVPHMAIPVYLNACDVLVLPYLHGTFMDAASSCKIAEYLYCRRPIVATRTPNFVQNFPDQAKQLETLLVPPCDVSALTRAIERQLDTPLIVDPPDNMSWQQIATDVMAHFKALCN